MIIPPAIVEKIVLVISYDEAGKTLERMIPRLKAQHRAVLDTQIKPALEKLAADSDHDVRFFASRAAARTCGCAC